METLFRIFDETAIILKKELDLSYLEALAETGENIFENQILQEVNDFTKKRLWKAYDSIKMELTNKEDIRKSFQLAILKGMKEAIQPNHEMTPDAVCLFFSYLVEKIMVSKQHYSLIDPAYGTGNLVTTILNHTSKPIKAYGTEIDDTLIKLGYVSANLQQHEIELFKQDGLQPIFVEPVDVVVADLPVGYYSNDIVAADYELKAEKGHSYIHHLYIEKGLKHLKDGGYFIAMIPNFLFESDEAPKLNKFIKDQAIIFGLLQLPLSMFKNDKHAKSIFILQKKGEGIVAPKQALLAELPSFSNKKSMEGMIQQIDNWFSTNLSF
ncbi:class I SAM-dependent methyltransferase [Bacillus sp. Marseille-P3661]|uniref:class I SAM-dependent methyltransferase n=1 Tax=Bacillus sp. Marseille-P3661 TaxID=1936234 RepID=UPI000C820B66|nr:class I SAM-dependent methyltransferase [Bacillus sp. Marseille-P3661]